MPEPIDIEITESRPGVRLDRYLAERFPGTSRGRFQQLITEGAVLVNPPPTATYWSEFDDTAPEVGVEPSVWIVSAVLPL
jgi:predicted rRNA methylase YqxC with S4 and FtsJ domains